MQELIKEKSMTSLELLKEINIFREKEDKTELGHNDLLKVIRDEFEEEISQGKISQSNYYSRGKEYPMFVLTLGQSKQVLSRESKFVRKAVIQYIENLEQQLQKPLSVEEMIIKQAESMIQVKSDIQRLEQKFDTVVTLESGKQRKIQLAVATRVYEILEENQIGPIPTDEVILYNWKVHYKNFKNALFSQLYRDIKRKFGVASYKDIKVVEYDKALSFINNWIDDKDC